MKTIITIFILFLLFAICQDTYSLNKFNVEILHGHGDMVRLNNTYVVYITDIRSISTCQVTDTTNEHSYGYTVTLKNGPSIHIYSTQVEQEWNTYTWVEKSQVDMSQQMLTDIVTNYYKRVNQGK
jgi:hypothetical protein